MNHWIATNTTDSCCLSKIVRRVVSHIIFTVHTVKSTGLRSGELGGQSVGRIKSLVSGSSSDMCLWHDVIGTPAEKPLFQCRTYVMECASGASLLYQDLGCRQTETTYQERVGRSESYCYWTWCCWRMAPASACLRSCWIQTFRAYDVKMMWLRLLVTTRLTIFGRQ